MAPDDPTVCLADLLLPRHIGRFVGNKPCQSCEMVRLTSGFCQYFDHIRERALRLTDEIVANQFTALIPADLAGNENLATFRGDPIGIAFGRHPVLWLQKLES